MRTTTWSMFVFVGILALCHVGFSSPIVKRQTLDNPSYIDPAQQDLDMQEETDRGKRKIESAIELKYGVKNAILGLFFNRNYKQLLHPKFHILHKRAVGVTPTPKQPTTTEDLVIFNPGDKVSLEVPDQLFGSGFSLVTNISQIVGSVIQDPEGKSAESLGPRPSMISDPSMPLLNLQTEGANSAERTAKLFEAIKPFLQTVFGVNSIQITRDGPSNNKI